MLKADALDALGLKEYPKGEMPRCCCKLSLIGGKCDMDDSCDHTWADSAEAGPTGLIDHPEFVLNKADNKPVLILQPYLSRSEARFNERFKTFKKYCEDRGMSCVESREHSWHHPQTTLILIQVCSMLGESCKMLRKLVEEM